MASSTHKYVVFTAMGCAGAVVIALVVMVVVTQRGGGGAGLGRLMREEPSTLHSAAAVDSLAAVRAWYQRPANVGAAFALRTTGSGDGAPIALAVWHDTVDAAWRPFGDTFPPGSRQYESWGRNVDGGDVDSLLAAARRPWPAGAGRFDGPRGSDVGAAPAGGRRHAARHPRLAARARRPARPRRHVRSVGPRPGAGQRPGGRSARRFRRRPLAA